MAVGAPLAALYDLLAPPALWHPTWRWVAMAVGVGFHGGNSLLFSTIHSFPFVCTAAYALFLRASPAPPPPPPPPPPPGRARLACSACAAAAWVAVQLLLPLRPYVLSDDPSWTKAGDTFAWRMMADVSDGWVSLTVQARRPRSL